MTREEIIQKINSTIDDAINKFNKNIPSIQGEVADELDTLIRSLDSSGRNIAVTVKNIRTIGQITGKLRRIILNTKYKAEVADFLKSFNEITTLQNLYFRQTSSDFKISPVLKEIKTQSIESTLQGLTENGLEANVINKVKEVLKRNITTGGTFRQLMDQMQLLVKGSDTMKSAFEGYIKNLTTDSLNQYSRNYLQTATQSLGMKWYQYTGSNIKTTRCFCHAMTKKRYFHESEIPKLLKGDFEEFQEFECHIYDGTNLPEGMIPGTNVSNFLVNLGGYNCGHRAIPIPARLVPAEIRALIEEK